MSKHIVHMENGRLTPDTPYTVVQQIVNDAVDHGKIVLHFHGGLVSKKDGEKIADFLTPEYQQAGAYPIFPVWESSLLETITNNMGKLASELFFRILLKRIRSIVKRKLLQTEGGRSSSSLPDIDFSDDDTAIDKALDNKDISLLPAESAIDKNNIALISDAEKSTLELELESDALLREIVNMVSNGLRDPEAIKKDMASRSAEPVYGSSETLMDPDVLEKLIDRPSPDKRGILKLGKVAIAIIKVAANVIKRFVNDRDHGLHATILEEILREFYVANIGGIIWSTMKQDTKDSFGDDKKVFGGTAILSEISKRIQAGDLPSVILIGHSTGAVYISHFIETAEKLIPGGFKFDIVLLAPASTFELTTDTLVKHKNRISNIRMFTMDDSYEKADILVKKIPILYPHSLLYFVSGVVEDESDMPIIGMQRFYDDNIFTAAKFPKVDKFRKYMMNINDSISWSVETTKGPGKQTAATSHGDFDNDPTTLLSLKHIIKNGF